MTHHNEDDFLLRMRTQIIQNELANIIGVSIRIINPNIAKIYYDFHNSSASKDAGMDESHTPEYSFDNYDLFEQFMLKADDNSKNIFKTISKDFAASKVIPREIFWYTYFSRQPIYLHMARNHPADENQTKAFYEAFLIKKVIDLNNEKEKSLIRFIDCWGLMCVLARVPVFLECKEKKDFHYFLFGLRPQVFPENEDDREKAIDKLLKKLPYDHVKSDKSVRDHISKIKQIEPQISEDQEKSQEVINDEKECFDYLEERAQMSMNVLERFKQTFDEPSSPHYLEMKSMKKQEWISLTRVFAFYEFKRQKDYFDNIFNSMKILDLDNIDMQTIAGTVTSDGKERLVLSSISRPDDDIKLKYNYLGTDYTIDGLKNESEPHYFRHRYSDKSNRYAFRFIESQKREQNKNGGNFLNAVTVLRNKDNKDLFSYGEQIGLALQSAYRRFVSRSDFYHQQWNARKVYALDRELTFDIRNQLPVDEKDTAIRVAMYSKIINRALRIAGGHVGVYITIDYHAGKLKPEARMDVHFSNPHNADKISELKGIDIHNSRFGMNCNQVIFNPNRYCMQKDAKNPSCCILKMFPDVKSCMCVPVPFNDRTMGIIHLQGRMKSQFNAVDVENIRNFADSMSPHLQHQHTLEALNELHTLGRLQDDKDMKTMMKELTNIICRTMLCDHASIWLWNTVERKLKLKHTTAKSLEPDEDGKEQAFIQMEEGIVGNALSNGGPKAYMDIAKFKKGDLKYGNILKAQGLNTLLVCRLYIPPDGLLGAITILNRERMDYGQSTQNYFKVLVDQISFVLFNLFETDKLREGIGHGIKASLNAIGGQANRLKFMVEKIPKRTNYLKTELINCLDSKFVSNNQKIEICKIINEEFFEYSSKESNLRYLKGKIIEDIEYEVGRGIRRTTDIMDFLSESQDTGHIVDMGKGDPVILTRKQKRLKLYNLIIRIIQVHRSALYDKKLKYDFKFIDETTDKNFSESTFKIWMTDDNFELIFGNVFLNAIKYSYEDGKIIVNVHICDDCFIIKVINEGVGIPEDNMHMIYDRGIRMREKWPSSFIDPGGSGYGLFIASTVALKYQIEVYCESSELLDDLHPKHGEKMEELFRTIFPCRS